MEVKNQATYDDDIGVFFTLISNKIRGFLQHNFKVTIGIDGYHSNNFTVAVCATDVYKKMI